MTTISIAAPAYNEEKNIKLCIDDWIDAFKTTRIEDFEIVICNDCSSDNTRKIVEEISTKNNKVRLVNHEFNKGAAAAVITAGNHANGQQIIFIDSDGQFPKESLVLMLKEILKNPNKNIFSYRDTKNDNWPQKIGTKLTTIIFNIYNKNKLKDVSCILKSFTYKNYKRLNLCSTGLNISTEMSCRSAELGQEITEVLVQHRARAHGESSASGIKVIGHGIRRLMLLKYYFYRKILIQLGIINP